MIFRLAMKIGIGKMGKVTLTKAAKDFMLENYGKVLAADIAKYLEVSTFTIQKWADKLGLQSDCSPKQRLDFSKKKSEYTGYCMDCAHYRPGGLCLKKNKDIGALNMKDCFKEKLSI